MDKITSIPACMWHYIIACTQILSIRDVVALLSINHYMHSIRQFFSQLPQQIFPFVIELNENVHLEQFVLWTLQWPFIKFSITLRDEEYAALSNYLSNNSSTIKNLYIRVESGKLDILPYIKNIYEIHLWNHAEECDVSNLLDVHSIYLRNCSNIKNINTLLTLHTLVISDCPIEEISTLINLHTLEISDCPIWNISTLTNLRVLKIFDCPIWDISALTNLHTLCCTNYRFSLKDISTLINLRVLSICSCPIRDISTLTNLHTLKISNCPIKNISTLVNLRVLSIYNCPIVDISALINLHTLNICCCPTINLYKLIGLPLHTLTILGKKIQTFL